jgi:hypothetical protein
LDLEVKSSFFKKALIILDYQKLIRESPPFFLEVLNLGKTKIWPTNPVTIF